MEEFTVMKQGSYKSGNWTQRVLSVHAPLGLASITAKDSQENKLYQSVRVGSVQIWPQYQAKHIKENFQSQEAKLTIRVKGVPAKIGFRDMNTNAGTQRIYRFTRSGPTAEHLTWMLRFSSFDALEKAVRLFQSMKVGDRLERPQGGTSEQAEGDLGGEGEEVKQEVDVGGVQTIIAGDLEEELQAIRGTAQQKPSQVAGYATL